MPIPDFDKQMTRLVSGLNQCGVRYDEAVKEFKRRYITNVLRENGNNQKRAAAALGIHRNTLSKIISDLQARRMTR